MGFFPESQEGKTEQQVNRDTLLTLHIYIFLCETAESVLFRN